MADVEQPDHSCQRFALAEVAPIYLFESSTFSFRYLSVSVTRKVHEIKSRLDFKDVEESCFARRAGDTGYRASAEYCVDEGGLSYVGASDDGYFREGFFYFE